MKSMPRLDAGLFVVAENDDIGIVAGSKVYYCNDDGYDKTSDFESGEIKVKYILKCRYGYEYIKEALFNIETDIPVPAIQVIWRYDN